MKLCVSATANSLDAPVDPRFGRCPYFVIVDLESMRFEVIPNVAFSATGGAGIQAAQIIAFPFHPPLITNNVSSTGIKEDESCKYRRLKSMPLIQDATNERHWKSHPKRWHHAFLTSHTKSFGIQQESTNHTTD